MLRTRTYLMIVLGLVLLVFSACNMPQRDAPPTVSGVDAINTAAAQTVSARLTQAAQPPPTSAVETAGSEATSVPGTQIPGGATGTETASGLPTATLAPGSVTPVPCDRVRFVEDVTYPDNAEVSAGSSFIKTWRLENVGSCTWTSEYALVFAGRDQLGAPETVPLPGSVAPGQTVDLSVTLQAPDTGGTYRSDFKLRNASGDLFGIGPTEEPFYVQVRVPVTSGLVYDFLARAAAATWESGTGSGAGASLTFGGATDDPNGTATIVEAVKLETGAISGKILLTYPRREPEGYISGIYPEYTVQNGDRLLGRLGFMTNPDGSCGAGDVVFQIGYQEGETVRLIDEWEDDCDGSLVPINIDLSNLRGQTIRFVLTVRAGGSAEDDWAIWNSLRIEHD